MKLLEPDITRRANELIDGFIERGECDFAQEFAVPLPCGVFLDLMGLPSDELDFFLQLKHDFLHGQEVSNEFLLDAKERANERFRRLIAERRRDPRHDLLTHLVNAQIESQPLTEEELLGICHLMVVAGLDTVTDSLTCFYAWLAGHPASTGAASWRTPRSFRPPSRSSCASSPQSPSCRGSSPRTSNSAAVP